MESKEQTFCYLPHYCSCPDHELIILDPKKLNYYEQVGYPKFINHHNRKGIVASNESRKNMSNAQKLAQRTPEARKRNSDSHKGLQSGEKHPMFGKKHKPESIIKIKEKRKIQNSPTLGKHWKMPKEWCEQQSERMKGSDNPMYDIHLEKDLHWNWQGGKSFEPYCPKFNDNFKEQIRERDNYICQLCGKSQEENGEKLCVHHIHHDKTNCYPDCIALCRDCNMHKVEQKYKIKYYESLFMNMLNDRNLLFWTKRNS